MLCACLLGRKAAGSLSWAALLCLPVLAASPAVAQTLIYQEGFNDDGDGTRYTTEGRGFGIFADGPGMWEHNFNADAIGLATTAPAKRAAILTAELFDEFTMTEQHFQVWDGLVDWMLDGKENANILFVPGFQGAASDIYSFRMEFEQGHVVDELDGAEDLPPASDVDLIIHTDGGGVTPPTKFVDYAVPVITYNAQNHDDTLISTIGAVAAPDPPEIKIVEANKDHPILGGAFSGSIPWATDVTDLQGIGAATPNGSTILATYVDPNSNLELPALVVVEEGGDMLGAFNPEPEGPGYFLGASTDDSDFGDGDSTPEVPKALELNPVDVSGQENVKVTVGLAATGVDFEASDFFRILHAPDGNTDFEVLEEFVGVDDVNSPNNKSLGSTVAAEPVFLRPDAFTDVTLDVPEGATELTVRFEAHNTFPNEIVAFDNVRITSGELVGVVGDCNGDGVVDVNDANCTAAEDLEGFLASAGLPLGDADGDKQVQFSDFVILADNFGNAGQYTEGDFDKDGMVQFGDFVVLANNFGQTAAATAAVPEPATSLLLLLGGVALLCRRRR